VHFDPTGLQGAAPPSSGGDNGPSIHAVTDPNICARMNAGERAYDETLASEHTKADLAQLLIKAAAAAWSITPGPDAATTANLSVANYDRTVNSGFVQSLLDYFEYDADAAKLKAQQAYDHAYRQY
jgi:hypothetical protein